MDGIPVQIIDIVKDEKTQKSTYNFKINEFHSILESVNNKEVAVISIADHSKIGKSFLLNDLLRYLSNVNNINCIEKNKELLKGGKWNQGLDPEAKGLWIWSKPIIVKQSVGKEIAIIIMDTQGVYDEYTDLREWSTIVGITLLTSSCFIFNVFNHIPEYILERLEIFMNYGSMAMERDKANKYVFQKLLFLIRDWNPTRDFPYGHTSGKKHINQILSINKYQTQQSQRTRELINKCFEEVKCYLMPEPGAHKDELDFDESVSELSNEFIVRLNELFSVLLNPDSLKPKVINGNIITGRELLKYFEVFVELFNGVKMIQPKDLVEAVAKSTDLNLICKLRESYIFEMKEELQSKHFQSSNVIEVFNNCIKSDINKTFETSMNSQSYAVVKQMRQKFNTELSTAYQQIYSDNEIKKKKTADDTITNCMNTYRENMDKFMNGNNFVEAILLEKQFIKLKDVAKKYFIAIFGCEEIDSYLLEIDELTKVIENSSRVENQRRKDGSKKTDSMHSFSDSNGSSLDKQNVCYTSIHEDNQDSPNSLITKHENENESKNMNQSENIFKESLDANHVSGIGKSNSNDIDFHQSTNDTKSAEVKADDFEDEESLIVFDLISEDGIENSFSFEEPNNISHDDTQDTSKPLVKENKIKMRRIYSEESAGNHSSMTELKTNSIENSNKKIKESKRAHSLGFQSLQSFPVVHRDLRRTSLHDSDSDCLNNTENDYKISETLVNENMANDTEAENLFKDLVNELILEYNKSMEIKLKDQVLDLKKTHNKKLIVNDSMHKLRDIDFIELTFFLLKKSYNAFKERNKLIKGKENFAFRALERKSIEYQEKCSETEKILTKAREEALQIYSRSMNVKTLTPNKRNYFKSNEFTENHDRSSTMAIESFNKSVEFFRSRSSDQEFANKLLIENDLLKKLITNEKQKLKSLNDRNNPDIHSMTIYLGKQYLMAATHCNNRYNIILDKYHKKLIPNSISFGEQILIGSEAKYHYEKISPDFGLYKNFDIKQLLGRERSCVSNDELSAFPFTFFNDKLSVYVNYHDIKTDLSIESLLAFMILDIKLCAEKQIGNIMSNVVLTVPTNYTNNQKNAIRNVAKIAGFKNCDLISEISAAAISYTVEKVSLFDKFTETVLFVILNDYECDVAICVITKKKIEYKVYFHQTINSNEEMKNNKKTEENDNNNTKIKFIELIKKVLKKANLKFDGCVIAGNSLLISKIKIWIKECINQIPLMKCDSLDILIKGSALYAEILANKIDSIKILEVTTHNILLNCDIKPFKARKIVVMTHNTALPKRKSLRFHLPKCSDLPLKITVSQDNQTVITHLINDLPPSYHCSEHLINIDVDFSGQIGIESVLSKKNQEKEEDSRKKLESIEINSGLNHGDLGEEKTKLCSLIKRGKVKTNEDNILLHF